MKINKVWSVFFSATKTTEKIVRKIADVAASELGAERAEYDFTLPKEREEQPKFAKSDLVIFGTPVYAGRVPNVLLKYLVTLEGKEALAVPIVVYGNRNYDDALIELRDILETDGFHTVSAGAFIGEHSFSNILACGRPDDEDFKIAETFAVQTAAVIKNIDETKFPEPVFVEGIPKPYRGYYQPRDREGTPVDIRKVKPLTDDNCMECGLCAEICPMGSINKLDVREFTGICIKCGACVKRCPVGAKYYEDERYLYHRHELEEGYARRAEPEVFIS